MQKLHITITILLIWGFSFSQQYTNFTTKDGLPSNHVYRITQDNQGFIWFITDKGMVKYNGTTFKIFTTKEGLPTNDIWDIRITPDNKVWYFTKAAKLGYIKNDSVFSFESTNNKIMFPAVINQNKNKVFFTNGERSYSLKNNKWQIDKSDKSDFHKVVNHPKINYFISKKEGNLKMYNHQSKLIKSIKYPRELKTYHHRAQVNDSLFIIANNLGYSVLNLNTTQLTEHNYIDKKSHKFTSKFVRFNNVNNSVQLSGLDFVAFLDQKNELTNNIKIPKRLNAHFSFIDKNKNIWSATFNKGVFFLPKSKQNTLITLENNKVGKFQYIGDKLIANVYNKGFYLYDVSLKNFLPFLKEENFIFSATNIQELNTEYYLSSKTIYSFKNGEKRKYSYKLNEIARGLIYYKGFLYGNITFGMNKIDPKNLKILKEYRQIGIRKLILFNKSIVIATSNGLKIFKDNKISQIDFKDDVLKKPILDIAKIGKELIVCTDGFGAYVTDLTSVYLLENSDFLSIQSAFVKNDMLWLATSIGILNYQKKEDTYQFVKKYTVKDGLSTNLINDVTVVKNNIIASSNEGVSILPLSQTATDSFIDLYFESTLLNNKSIKNNEAIRYTNNNYLSTTIASIDFTENNTLNYSYQLLPVQKNWIETTSNQLVFHDLKPKKYTLKIKSVSKKNLPTKITSLQFKIKPLIYQTISFKIISGLLLVFSMLYFIWIISERKQKKKEEKLIKEKQLLNLQLKALRSQMNPHFVFNSLAAIQYYIIENNFEASETYLLKFSKLIRQFFELSKEENINLETEIKLLKNYLDIESLRFIEKLNYTLNIDSRLSVSEVKIPTMLLQPIVENAINHGIFNKLEKGNVTINFIFVDIKTFKVEIIDDGVGFKNTKKKTFKKVSSTIVIEDRLRFLNESKNWNIKYYTEEVYPDKTDKGNKSTFIITQINR